jgi:DNA-binding FrmR family transcriptional regulator
MTTPATEKASHPALEEDITRRLRRIEGQARGILKMLDERRDCEEMLTQTMAMRSALDQVGARLMEYHLNHCILEGFDCEPDRMAALRDALKLWTRYGQPAPAMTVAPYED